MNPEADPGLYRWTELVPDAATIAAGIGVGADVRLLSATEIVARGRCEGMSLHGGRILRIVVDGTSHIVGTGIRVFVAVPRPAVPRYPETPLVRPDADRERAAVLIAELEEVRDRAVATLAAIQAMAEESAALLEAARLAAATPRALRGWTKPVRRPR